VPSAPPGWPVSAAPYTAVPAPVAVAPPQRGRASLVILSILSTVLLLGVGVLTVLYINDRQTISQQRTLIDQNAADIKAKAAELDNTKKDLDSTKKDLDTEKACADTIRDYFKQLQSMLSTLNPQTGIDPQSPEVQAIAASSQALITKCGIKLG
jgi:septal ring factor EnvC (AmiA/AmiB activator)